jgi:hypothetical protein
LAKGLDALGAASGRNLTQLAASLREATDGAISLEQSLRATALASSGGISGEEFVRLGAVARNASVALGRDLADSLDRLTRGVTKLEPEILDELGLIIRVDEASEKYAATIGKTASELTNLEKRQAFLNEALAQGEEKFGEIGESVSVDGYTQLAAAIQDVLKSISSFINNGAEKLAAFFAAAPAALFGVAAAFTGSITKQIVPSLQELSTQAQDRANDAKEALDGFSEKLEKTRKAGFKGLASGIDPKSVNLSKELLSDLSEGTNLEEVKLKLTRSISGTEKAIEKGFVGRNKLTQDQIALMNTRIAQQRLLLTLIDDENKKSEQLSGTNTRLATATAGASAASSLATVRQEALSDLDSALLGPLEKTKSGLKGVKDSYSAVYGELDKAPKKFKIFSAAANAGRASIAAAGTAVQFFGSALLRLLPFIGLIIVGFEVLSSILSFLVDKLGLYSSAASEVEEESSKLVETLKNQEKANEDAIASIDRKIQKLKQEEDVTNKIIKIGALQAQQSVIIRQEFLDREKAIDSLILKQKEWNKEAGFFQRGWFAFFGNDITDQIEDLREEQEKSSISSAKSAQAFVNSLNELRQASKTASQAFSKFNSESRIKTQFDEISAAIDSPVQALIDLQKQVKEGEVSRKELQSGVASLAKNFEGLGKEIGIPNIAEELEADGGLENVLNKIFSLKKNIDKAIESTVSLERQLKALGGVRKELSGLAKSSSEIQSLSVDLANKELSLKIKQKQAVLAQTNDEEARKNIQAEIFSLSLQQTSEEERSLLITKTTLEVSKQALAIEQKILQASIQKAQADQKLIESRAKLAQLEETGTTELNAKRQLDVQVKAAKLALDTARKQFELKNKQIDAEAKLQKNQFKILEAQAKVLKAQLAARAAEEKDPAVAAELRSASDSLSGINFQEQISQIDALSKAQKEAAKSVLDSAEAQFQVSIAEAFRGVFQNNEIYQTFASNLRSNLTAFFKGETTIGEAIGGAIISALEKKAETLLEDAFRLFENTSQQDKIQQIYEENGIKVDANTKATDKNTEAKLRESQAPALVQGPGDSTIQTKDVEAAGQSTAVAAAAPDTEKKGFFSTLLGQKREIIREGDVGEVIGDDGVPTTGAKAGKPGKGLIGGLENIFGSFKDGLGMIFSKDSDFLGGLGEIFGGSLDGFSQIFSGIGEAFGGLFGGGGGGGGLGSLLKMGLSFIPGLGGLFGAQMGGIYQGGISAFAKGGVVKRATVGLVGEGGQNEAVVPLPDGKAIPVNMNGTNNNNNVSDQ